MPHIPKAICRQDPVAMCQATVLADLRPLYGDARMVNYTAGTIPVESWFCILFEHVFNCSITSCQIVQARLAIGEHLESVVKCILGCQNTSRFVFKKSDCSYCLILRVIHSNAQLLACFNCRVCTCVAYPSPSHTKYGH
jgi:hypothetical protein